MDSKYSININGTVGSIGIGDGAQSSGTVNIVETERRLIHRFQDERLIKIAADETPVPLKEPARVVMHVVPSSARALNSRIDVRAWSSFSMPPLGVSGFNPLSHVDGPVHQSGAYGESQVSYLQLLRSGIVETVMGIRQHQPDRLRINLSWIEEAILDGLEYYLKAFKEKGVEPPFLILIALLGVNGASLYQEPHHGIWEGQHQYSQDQLKLIDIELQNEEDIEVSQLHAPLRPAFDMLWNAFGVRWSYCYDEGGEWVGKIGETPERVQRHGRKSGSNPMVIGNVNTNAPSNRGSSPTKPAKSSEAGVQRLREKGQVPILKVFARTREWPNRAEATFRIVIENTGRVIIAEFRRSLDEFKSKHSLAVGEETALAVKFRTPDQETPVSQTLVFRYVTEFGHTLEQQYDLSFDPRRHHLEGMGLTIVGRPPVVIQE